ncbi:hypothetical protein JCM8202_002889 [Rhodotorula sphaerocarpa]
MPQGGKLKAPAGNPHKAKSSTQKKQQQPKKGQRNCPPKRAAAVSQATVHRKHTSSHASAQEETIAAQAIGHGKLTIMRQAAEKVRKQNENGK